MTTHHYNVGLLFSEVASSFADQVALRYAGRDFSFSEVSGLVERLAGLLLAMGLSRGDVIAIGHEKRVLSYALMLAALRLGIPYANIDVASPLTRSARILDVSSPSVLFFDDPAYAVAMTELASTQGCRLAFLDEQQLPVVDAADLVVQMDLARKVDGSCIAYIMYTSGSTGVPKGVAVTHQNVLHFIAWGQSRFGITARDNFANLSPMYFDNSVFDFYVGLFCGAALTPISRELLSDPYALTAYVGRLKCTIWFSVPSLLIYLMTMKALTSESLLDLRTIVFGGEGYPKVELQKLYRLFSGQAELVNVYGPTECTCICSAYTLTDRDFEDLHGLPTLGMLNPNFDYRLLDRDGRDAVTGELFLIGPNVAAGYFNDSERTSAVFSTLSEPARFGKRMYRTGDLVHEEAGQLYFMGRKDNQIKHMGYRIELEEIEHALMKVPLVDQAAVVYQRVSSAYGKLVAFVASHEVLDESTVLGNVGDLLPAYMIPNKLFVMRNLPKNPNGKVDRLHLLGLLDD
ncbi:AMP-binding protein [Thiocapsa roseopersicina]|uniref:L-prolyl-[peptidyl carrier protein] synthetase n=1 Tax=Thiocapsa roseopersicina TaxID=1058 RepID=A0A1H2QES4_THIRO|nr:AMP-binding protein [Thiocapsa roseopersicina]SDW05134.1 L-prolyl-[peptidyl carrier protein] synthetase [Thiocapsa roseopersicina]